MMEAGFVRVTDASSWSLSSTVPVVKVGFSGGSGDGALLLLVPFLGGMIKLIMIPKSDGEFIFFCVWLRKEKSVAKFEPKGAKHFYILSFQMSYV